MSITAVKRDFSTPEATFKTMKEAAAKGDLAAFEDCFMPGSATDNMMGPADHDAAQAYMDRLKSQVDEAGNKWKLDYLNHDPDNESERDPDHFRMYSSFQPDKSQSYGSWDSIAFQNENGRWKILLFTRGPGMSRKDFNDMTAEEEDRSRMIESADARAAAPSSVPADFSTPENTFATVKAAARAGDLALFKQCFSSGAKAMMSMTGKEDNVTMGIAMDDFKRRDSNGNGWNLDGGDQSGSWRHFTSFYTEDAGSKSGWLTSIDFVQEDGGWRISDYEPIREEAR